VAREDSYNERPHWTVPLDIRVGRQLRELFGRNLVLGDVLAAWAKNERARERNLGALAMADDHPLDDLRLAGIHPEFARWLRPYQRADVKFMAQANLVNGLQMSLGKTAETVAATMEGELTNGAHLVIAPKTSLETVWQEEINKWLPDHKVFIWSGEVRPKDRPELKAAMQKAAGNGHPWWLVTTPDALRRGLPVEVDEWATFAIDEYHKHGLTNASGDPSKGTAFARAARQQPAKRKWALSGTPLGGKPIKLWGALHWLYPEKFTSKWRWAAQWLEITADERGYKQIGGIKPGFEEDFYCEHAPYLLRRLKVEVLPDLPKQMHQDVWVRMGPAQAAQYRKFEAEAEIRIEDEKLTAVGILAEYNRLKSFANAKCKVEQRPGVTKDGKPKPPRLYPDDVSCKLEPLLENLAEQGITADEDRMPGELALVGSQSEEFVSWLTEQLRAKGLVVEKLTGKTKQEDRVRIQREARDPDKRAQVILMTTQTGGVSINLEPANSVHVMDETWVPDEQDQLVERADRGSRETPLQVFWYRTRGTIQEDIYQRVQDKAITNKEVLDLHRQRLKKVSK
jgi:Zierdtviridae DNA helicase